MNQQIAEAMLTRKGGIDWSGYWPALLKEVCGGGVSRARLQEILEALLYDDGDDIELNVLTGRHDRYSPALTPVERLLHFVSTAFERLQDEFPADTMQPQDFPPYLERLANLRDLVHLGRMPMPPRPFSRVERLRLMAQESQFAYEYATTVKQIESTRFIRVAEADHRLNATDLDELERGLRGLPPNEIEVQFIQALCVYRRCLPELGGSPEQQESAVRRLTELFKMPNRSVPKGLYFHACRRIFLLPIQLQCDIARKCRMPLAMAFVSMHEYRALDRIGMCFLLSRDALACSAPEIAKRLVELVDRFIACSTTIEGDERLKGQILAVRRKLSAEIDAAIQEREDLAQHPVGGGAEEALYKSLVSATSALIIASGISEALPMLSTHRPDEPLVSKLYKNVCQSWLARLVPGVTQAVSTQSFIDTLDVALTEHRKEPLVGRLLRAGLAIRFQSSRGAERIDDAFDDFDRLLAICALCGEWRELVDQLCIGGNRRFLKKIGVAAESKRLDNVAGHFQQVFGLTATPPESRDTSEGLDSLLLGQAHNPQLRFEVGEIQERWHPKEKVGDGDTSVPNWAQSYASARRRAEFCPESSDPVVQGFFADCRRIVDTERVLASAQMLDVVPIWTDMAWFAFHVCNVLRRAGAADQKIQGMDAQDWIDAGIRWADAACALSGAKGPRTAHLFRALEVRKRLERKRPAPDIAVLRRLTHDALSIDEARLDTTSRSNRRDRAVMRTERSLIEAIREWKDELCSLPTGDDKVRYWFEVTQKLKSLNFGQLFEQDDSEGEDEAEPAYTAADAETDGSGWNPRSDRVFDYSESEDVFDRIDPPFARLSPKQQSVLWNHLRDRKAAILDFLTHPGSRGTRVQDAQRNEWGTVCFVVKAGVNGLLIQPFFLPDLTEAEILRAIKGTADAGREGLQNLANWSNEKNGAKNLDALGTHIFPEAIKAAVRDCDRVYLCPHRHMFLIPIHALPRKDPLFQYREVSYALKTTHVAELASRPSLPASPRRRLVLVDRNALVVREGKDDRDYSGWVLGAAGPRSNQWNRRSLSTEEIIREASGADQAVICCHGQMDLARFGKTRLRLWGGGRLLADDVRRTATLGPDKLDLSRSDWLVAACDAGSAKIAMKTAPGFSLSFVTCGASRVTSSLYRITPETGARFVSAFLRASNSGKESPFMAALGEISSGPGSWGNNFVLYASFVSYGLFQNHRT